MVDAQDGLNLLSYTVLLFLVNSFLMDRKSGSDLGDHGKSISHLKCKDDIS